MRLNRSSFVAVSAVVVAMVFTGVSSEVGAQSSPPWPTAVVTPAPSASPASVDPEPTPTPVVTPTPPPDRLDPTPTPSPTLTVRPIPVSSPVVEEAAPESPPKTPAPDEGGESGGGDSTAEEPTIDTPKSEQVTNPGDVAFTDYAPFDLDEIEPEPMKSKWGNFVSGLRGITRFNLFDGKVKFRLGARLQVDGTAGNGNEKFDEFYPPIESRLDVRRFRLFAAGRISKFNFNLSFDLGPDWGMKDAWIEGSEGGLEVWGKYIGKLRLGFMKEPFSFERSTSSFHTGLLERSLPVQTFSPGSNLGLMVHDSTPKGRLTWAFGLFSVGQNNDSNASASALSLTGRVTYNPVYRNEGRNLLHFGVSVSSRSPVGSDTQYRSRPEARFVGYLVDTGVIDASHLTLLGVEFATIQGPLWMAAEYIQSDVSAQLVGDPTFRGSYAQVGWFLTGESRPFRLNGATWDRGRPAAKFSGGNAFKEKRFGSFEVVGRISTVDLNDGLIEGGQLTNISAALNWYPNATTRVELNYIYASPKNQGAANIFVLRLQYMPW